MTTDVTTDIQLAESISLSPKNLTLTEGDTYSLLVQILPSNTTNKSITWKSSNTSVASVSNNGVITAHKKGTANITATTSNGLTMSCALTVNHLYGEWKETKAPTCTENGEEKRECANCKAFETRETNKTAHDFKAEFTVDVMETCTIDGSKSRHCKDCDAKTDITVIKAVGHKYISRVIKDSTCSETGLIEYICECGSSYTEIIPVTGHIDNNGDGNCDKCNENLDTDSCNCMCHKTGCIRYIWKIIRFFYRLFGINKTCACGMAHY